MAMWRKKVEKNLRPYLEKFVTETHRHKEAFERTDDPSKAQLWIAIALLSKQLYNLEMKLNYLERALKDISQAKEINEGEKFLQEIEQQVKNNKENKKEINLKQNKETDEEVKDILSRIARGKKNTSKNNKKSNKKK